MTPVEAVVDRVPRVARDYSPRRACLCARPHEHFRSSRRPVDQLPGPTAFPGTRPYHQAHARGVKMIGATTHYVSGELDAGSIIAQDIARVSHRDLVDGLIRKGRDGEKLALARARAGAAHPEQRVLAVGSRTIVFP